MLLIDFLSFVQKSVQELLERIRIVVFKFGIRTPEFFKDYDKLRSGFITEAQFIAALTLAVGRQAKLTSAEIQKITEFYRDTSSAQSRVDYRSLCNFMETGVLNNLRMYIENSVMANNLLKIHTYEIYLFIFI